MQFAKIQRSACIRLRTEKIDTSMIIRWMIITSPGEHILLVLKGEYRNQLTRRVSTHSRVLLGGKARIGI